MAEGLNPTEVGKELTEHAKHHADKPADGDPKEQHHDHWISIAEAILLALVTITAAWSGFSAAKWGTESSLKLAKASATRTKANREFQQSLTYRVGDATTFNAWFGAYIAGHANAARVAEKRFRPQYDVAFKAWMAEHPFTNPHAAPGPQQMPQYHPDRRSRSPTRQGRSRPTPCMLEAPAGDAHVGDDYVRVTVILASVLFIVGHQQPLPAAQHPFRALRARLAGSPHRRRRDPQPAGSSLRREIRGSGWARIVRFLVLAGLAAAVAAGASSGADHVRTGPASQPPLLVSHHGAAEAARIVSFVPSGYPNAYGLRSSAPGSRRAVAAVGGARTASPAGRRPRATR